MIDSVGADTRIAETQAESPRPLDSPAAEGRQETSDVGVDPGKSAAAVDPVAVAVRTFEPTGDPLATPILSWVNSRQSGVLAALPNSRWSVPYLWLSRESGSGVWNDGRSDSRRLRDNPAGLRGIRPYDSWWLKGNGRSGESKWGFRDELVLDRGLPSERSLGFVAPWFDEWREKAYAVQRRLASEMAAAGGTVDYLIMDFEDYNTLYNVLRDLEALGASLEDYRSAVIGDPRWPSLRSSLNAAAAAAGYDRNVVSFDDNLADIGTWNQGHSPKGWVWGRFMQSQINEALEHVLYDAWAEFFPDIMASDYNKYINGPWPEYTHATWSVDGPTVPLSIGTDTHWIVGTHQAPEGYGTRGLPRPTPIQIHMPASDDPPMLPMRKWSPPAEMDEKFAVLIKSLRKLRGAVVNRGAGGKPPIMMWVCGDQYDQSIWVPAGGAADYQWYAEALFHFGMHDIDTWLFWNTPRMADGSSERRLERIVSEIDTFVGGVEGRRALVTRAPNWDTDRYVLSGMDVGDWDVYRFTPGEPGRVVTEDPFVFEFTSDAKRVEPVAGGTVYRVTGTMSEVGYWVVASGQ